MGVDRTNGEYKGIKSITFSKPIYDEYYGLSVNEKSTSELNFTAMQTVLNSGTPIAAQCVVHMPYKDNPNDYYYYHHAVAIRGYVKYSNSTLYSGSFSYMENETNPAQYVAASVSMVDEYNHYYRYMYKGSYESYTGIENYFDYFMVVSQ